MPISLSIESKIREALVLLFQNDTDLNTYWAGRIYAQQAGLDANSGILFVPQLVVQNRLDTDDYGRNVGPDYATPMIDYDLIMFEPPTLYPVPPNTVSSMDRMVAVEKLLERGTVANGKLRDPYYAAPGHEWLNVNRPNIRRRLPRLVKAKDGRLVAVAYTIRAGYETRKNPLTGGRA